MSTIDELKESLNQYETQVKQHRKILVCLPQINHSQICVFGMHTVKPSFASVQFM